MKLVNRKGKTITFARDCKYCNKQQILKETKHYTAGEYIWTNI